jgi:hypothetical protein
MPGRAEANFIFEWEDGGAGPRARHVAWDGVMEIYAGDMVGSAGHARISRRKGYRK